MEYLSLLLLLKKKLKPAISWILGHTRLTIELLLVLALILAGYLYRRQERQLRESQTQYGILAESLQQQIVIKDNEIKVLKRKNGKVETKVVYVPIESPIIIDYPIPTPLNPNPQPIMHYKLKGWCFKPGMGLAYGLDGFQGRLDAKVAYKDRLSMIVGGSLKGIGVGVSRHVDDILWFRPSNLEVFVSYDIIHKADVSPVLIGIRSNF